MSYSVWLEIDTGGEEPTRIEENLEITGNCTEVLRHAFGNWMSVLDGKHAGDMAREFLRAAQRIEENPAVYQDIGAHLPCNVRHTICFLRKVSDLCARHPKCKLRIC